MTEGSDTTPTTECDRFGLTQKWRESRQFLGRSQSVAATPLRLAPRPPPHSPVVDVEPTRPPIHLLGESLPIRTRCGLEKAADAPSAIRFRTTTHRGRYSRAHSSDVQAEPELATDRCSGVSGAAGGGDGDGGGAQPPSAGPGRATGPTSSTCPPSSSTTAPGSPEPPPHRG